MLKKILMLCALCVGLIVPARAELKVDIVAGGADPISIAVQRFEVADGASQKDADQIRSVVEADLKRTGLFHIVNHDAFMEHVKMNDMPNFKSWQAIKAQVLVQAKLYGQSNNQYKLEFYVWDVNGREQIEAQSLVATRKSVRRLAHSSGMTG